MLTRFFPIDVPAGRLATMPRPRGGDRLDDEMSALRTAGVDVLVSALTIDEYDRLDLTREPAAARAAGCEFVRFPIPDLGVPRDLSAALAVADTIAAHLRGGRFVVTHCWGGIGRSTLLAASAMIRLGIPAQDAMDLISAARGLRVPETDAQREWLRALPGGRA